MPYGALAAFSQQPGSQQNTSQQWSVAAILPPGTNSCNQMWYLSAKTCASLQNEQGAMRTGSNHIIGYESKSVKASIPVLLCSFAQHLTRFGKPGRMGSQWNICSIIAGTFFLPEHETAALRGKHQSSSHSFHRHRMTSRAMKESS